MRKIAVVAALLGMAAVAVPAHAQDILGLTLRPTDAMPDGSVTGLIDLVSTGDGTEVSVDLSGAADALTIEDYEDATEFVVWAVDMDGVRHNLGPLNGDLVLEDAPVDFLVARIFMTAEADAEAQQPTGDRLYEVTLRRVDEVDTIPMQTESSDEPTDEDAGESADTEEEGSDAAGEGEDEGEGEGEGEEAQPKELPTTGDPVRDLLVLAALAIVLIGGGMRLRAVRI